jgi:transcriptional regulator with XRE-family HTH domain
VGDRAVKHVRKFLGQRLRALRKQRGLSQERLGERSSLSGKFIGEVERGEKSISIDSLYHVSVALEIPLRELTDVRADRQATVPTEEAEKIFALVSGRRRPETFVKLTRCSRLCSTAHPRGRRNHRRHPSRSNLPRGIAR